MNGQNIKFSYEQGANLGSAIAGSLMLPFSPERVSVSQYGPSFIASHSSPERTSALSSEHVSAPQYGPSFIASHSSDLSPNSPKNVSSSSTEDAVTPDRNKPKTDPPALVEVRGLKKTYTFKPILRGIDLTVARGERIALLGANGAGKTTLLRILACLTKPASGSALVAGLDCVREAQQVRRLIGFVAHQPYLYEDLTALENLLFFARMYSVPQAQERSLELLRRVGLERRQHERVSTLSRGLVQRLSWVRALLHTPSLLLLDEADTGLDQSGRELIDSFLAEHTARGGSALFITHQLERALQLSDHILLLASGRIVYQQETAQLTLEELQQRYQEVVR